MLTINNMQRSEYKDHSFDLEAISKPSANIHEQNKENSIEKSHDRLEERQNFHKIQKPPKDIFYLCNKRSRKDGFTGAFQSPPRVARHEEIFSKYSPTDTLEYSASEELSGQPTLNVMDKFPYIPTESLAFSDEESDAKEIQDEFKTPQTSPRRQRHSIQDIRTHFKILGSSIDWDQDSIHGNNRILQTPSVINLDQNYIKCGCSKCFIF